MTTPLMPWLNERASGALLHPLSLHGTPGCGVLGPAVREFLQFLREAEMTYWQVLPLGPTGYGDSPYQCFSAFAGNPYLIDIDPLVENGLLRGDELQPLQKLEEGKVDYSGLYRIKWPLLRLAWRRFKESGRAYLPNYGRFADFCEERKEWLEPYAAFMAAKDHFGGRFWGEWPEELRSYEGFRKSPLFEKLENAREAHSFIQYVFFGQWNLVRKLANELGIQIIGDAPIFVSLDSADVWARPDLFLLNKKGLPEFVAGVPPDYFSLEGQLWGNPLYDWEAAEKEGYRWWIERLRANFEFYDVVRLDHFRGFYDYWAIPAEATSAKAGAWRMGPGIKLFEAVKEALPEARLIAEDLGEIGPEVRAFRDETGLPGMVILQFAFDGKGGDNLYLPHNHVRNAVVYPGTHDNNTTIGWYEAASSEVTDHVRRYYRISGEDVAWDFIRSAYRSVANLAIIPMQDLMSLDGRSRMNTPGSALGNWSWRMTRENFHWQRGATPYLRELAWLYDR
jgi:4-alpha-glucanotransferase